MTIESMVPRCVIVVIYLNIWNSAFSCDEITAVGTYLSCSKVVTSGLICVLAFS